MYTHANVYKYANISALTKKYISMQIDVYVNGNIRSVSECKKDKKKKKRTVYIWFYDSAIICDYWVFTRITTSNPQFSSWEYFLSALSSKYVQGIMEERKKERNKERA